MIATIVEQFFFFLPNVNDNKETSLSNDTGNYAEKATHDTNQKRLAVLKIKEQLANKWNTS